MTVLKSLLASSLVALVALAPASASIQAQPEMDGLKHIKQFAYDGGSELAGQGRYLYSGEANAKAGGQRGTAPDDGGLHIFDIKQMKEVGFLHCPGTDNDVELVKPGLVVMAFRTNMCVPSTGGGIMLIDVKDPSHPKIISALNTNGADHTVKPFPGGKYVYMAGGGLTGGGGAGPVIVDVSNPAKPKIAAEPQTITMDCHDISFKIIEEGNALGFCAGALGTGETQIWDVSDPLAPTVISRIINPAIQYSHYGVANHDGTILAIDDEAFVAHECVTSQSATGRVWFYDISNPLLPIPIGNRAAPRGGGPGVGTLPGWIASWCMSHGLDWHPKTNNVAVTWYTGGVSVLHMEGPSVLPEEIAYFQAEDSLTYSTLWHGGYLWTNDHGRGVDAFKVKGLK